jgi:serine/threonine-protein phosphatase 5
VLTTQAYYRRAVAHTAILHHADALRDWKVVVKKNPSDKLSQSQLEICTKIVKKNAFLKAIAIADPPSADEGLDLDSMVVEASYDGAELGEEMTQEFIDDMIKRFRDQKTLHRKYVYRIVLKVKEILDKEPTMVEVEIPEGHTLTVCGDTHGRLLWPQDRR